MLLHGVKGRDVAIAILSVAVAGISPRSLAQPLRPSPIDTVADDSGELPRQCAARRSSAPVSASFDNQLIENLDIVSAGGPGIIVHGKSGVTIRNVAIHHMGGAGIEIGDAPNTTIQDADITFDGAPPAGQNPGARFVNVDCYNSQHLTIRNLRLVRGSSGIRLDHCHNSVVSFIEGHDFRGPFPRGQLIQWIESDGGQLSDFSAENSIETAWTEDIVNAWKSSNITIRRGLVDGNNSISGDAVIADDSSHDVLVEDVDALHQTNGCFSVYGGPLAHDVTFRRTRCSYTICGTTRGKPLSNALAWAAEPTSGAGLRIEDSTYGHLCNPGNIVWDRSKFDVVQLEEADFIPRAPMRLQTCR
jgi:parallel beta helix pectate lyase-like protein